MVDDRLTVGGGTVHLLGDDGPRGVLAWSLEPAVPGDLDGLAHRPAPLPAGERAHPNGVVAVDHVVVGTPDPTPAPAALVGLAFTATDLDAVAAPGGSPARPATRSSRGDGSSRSGRASTTCPCRWRC